MGPDAAEPAASLRQLQSSLLRNLCRSRRSPRSPQPPSGEAARPAAKIDPSLRRRCPPKRPSQHRLPSVLPPILLQRQQPELQPPVEPVKMTPAQERAMRYMQRADRYMELLARNTLEL